MAIFIAESTFGEGIKRRVWVNPKHVQSLTASEKNDQTYINLGNTQGFWVLGTLEETLAKLGLDIE